jgi:hypothetical protein
MDPVGKLLASIDILLAYSTYCAAFSFLNAFPFSLKLLSLQCKKRSVIGPLQNFSSASTLGDGVGVIATLTL